ncbi:hypothetical protein EG329_003412 [Mollisiaceae sp. DMI_Dod_QoI]|nr:hypothetical protein EG329_003412 [Helotiales sp. DMI_Dod_QoI]
MILPKSAGRQYLRRTASFELSPGLGVTIGISIASVIISAFIISFCFGLFRASWEREGDEHRPVTPEPLPNTQGRSNRLSKAVIAGLPLVRFGNIRVKDVELGQLEVEHAPVRHSRSSQGHQLGRFELETLSKTDKGGIGLPCMVNSSDPAMEARRGESSCSICLDDFVESEDIRLLPCDHKFHPKCVDPWLENVSGSYPVCRYNIPPTESSDHPLRA